MNPKTIGGARPLDGFRARPVSFAKATKPEEAALHHKPNKL